MVGRRLIDVPQRTSSSSTRAEHLHVSDQKQRWVGRHDAPNVASVPVLADSFAGSIGCSPGCLNSVVDHPLRPAALVFTGGSAAQYLSFSPIIPGEIALGLLPAGRLTQNAPGLSLVRHHQPRCEVLPPEVK